MYSGPPTYLMWSSMFKPDGQRVDREPDWRRIGALFRPYSGEIVRVLACILAVSLLGLVPPVLTMRLIDHAIPGRDLATVGLYAGLMVASAVAAGLIGVYQGYLNSVVGEGIMRDIRTRLVAHLHTMPLSFFTATKTGEIMSRVGSDVDQIDHVVNGTLVTIVTNSMTILTTTAAIFLIDWRLALLSLAVIPLMVAPLWPVGRKLYVLRKQTRQKNDELSAVMQETLSLSGVTLVKSFAMEEYERQRFDRKGAELADLEIELSMVGRWFLMVITSMVTIGPAVIWLAGGWLAINHGVTVGVIVTFTALLFRLYTPASVLAGVQVQVVSALAVFERIFEYLDMPSEDRQEPGAAGGPARFQGAVAFSDVWFSYQPDRPVLRGVSFSVQPGSQAAFVGVSGAGKTTITQLVPRFWTQQAGVVSIDGVDNSRIPLEILRANIGMVTQETYLFHNTIAANLLYAKPDASMAELEAACRLARIHDLIASLPEGYDTVVGERGHKLSGGERQRIAIARVLLKDPAILILDEATSSLDSHNEALIQEALSGLKANRTSLIIAHRLSTVVSADVIFVVASGQIVESGRHDDLVRLGGTYASLYEVQFREPAWIASKEAENTG